MEANTSIPLINGLDSPRSVVDSKEETSLSPNIMKKDNSCFGRITLDKVTSVGEPYIDFLRPGVRSIGIQTYECAIKEECSKLLFDSKVHIMKSIHKVVSAHKKKQSKKLVDLSSGLNSFACVSR